MKSIRRNAGGDAARNKDPDLDFDCVFPSPNEILEPVTQLQTEFETTLQVSLLHGALPADVESARWDLYDNVYASAAYSRVFAAMPEAAVESLVIENTVGITAVLNLVRQGRQVRVLNRCLNLPSNVVSAATRWLFEESPRTSRVCFEGNLADHSVGSTPALCKRFVVSEDYILTLPDTADLYLRMLGAKTRQHLRAYERKFQSLHPEARFSVTSRAAITREQVARVVRLNRLRMSAKGVRPGIDKSYEAKLHTLCTSHGRLFSIQLGARTVAGAICTEYGTGIALHVIAHDPDYDHLNLGHVCLYRAILFAIDSDFSTFHFLWGDSDYKTRFGAKRIELWKEIFYRDRGAQVLDFGHRAEAVRMMIRSAVRRARGVRRRIAAH